MSSARPFDHTDANRQVPNTLRLLPISLFHQMEHLLDNNNGRHQVHVEDTTSLRRRDLMINRPIEQYEGQEDLVDIDYVLASCAKETYRSNHLSGGFFNKNHQDECSICLERFETDEGLLRLPCSHLFHNDCLLPWITSNHDKCPLCRAKIVPIGRMSQGFANVPLGNANNGGPENDMYSHSQFFRGSRESSTNNPIHIINVHINRNAPPRTSNGPPQNSIHSIRVASPHFGAPSSRISTNSYSSSSENNEISFPVRRNLIPAVRDIPIDCQRQPYGHGASVREIPISHRRPHHYPQNLISRGGYTRRHGSNELTNFENEESTSAILTRLSLWI